MSIKFIMSVLEEMTIAKYDRFKFLIVDINLRNK